MTPKRKSLANANTTPNKVQKIAGSPMFHKKNKSPKPANQISPQKKQINGKQHTPKGKKAAKAEPEPEEDEEVLNASLENESDSSIEQAVSDDLNESAAAEEDDDSEDEDDDDDDDDVEDKPAVVAVKGKPVKNETGKGEDRKFSVFVGDLDYKATEADLRGVFNKCSILSIFILRNPVTKRPSGAAFVNLTDEASKKRALTKNGIELLGRKIKVGEPTERKPKAAGDPKKQLLNQLKLQVKKLEKELGGAGGPVPRKNNFQKFTGGKRPKNNLNKKNFKSFKSE